MTAKGLYDALLVELNKVNAPSLLLEDYNYFINKAVSQYINKRYILYDTSQQTTDDLRVLKATATIPVSEQPVQIYGSINDPLLFGQGNMFGATYEFNLPKDYLHMLNCTCVYYVAKPYKCYPVGKYWNRPATRLTADAWSTILDNAYMCPTYRRPYYYIHNVNQQEELPTNIYNRTTDSGTDLVAILNNDSIEEIENSTYKRVVSLEDIEPIGNIDAVDKTTYSRLANPTAVRCEIRYGKDTEVFLLKYAIIDYIKAPLHIKLTQELIDLTIDRSQILEFPDYVCQEIINELVMLVMENASDLRVSTQPRVSESIVLPTQQLAQLPQKA